MDLSIILSHWLILSILIFCARIIDVSLGTIRLIFIARGYKFIAPILGFFEILIWLVAIRQIMLNLTNPAYYIAYAAGFAGGTFVGMLLEEKISIGKEIFRIITRRNASKLIRELRKRGFITTVTEGKGPEGQVKVIFSVVERQDQNEMLCLIKKYNPHSFYSIEDVRLVKDSSSCRPRNHFLFRFRKGK